MSYKQTLHTFYNLILGVFIVRVKSFTPSERVGHSSVLVGTKLYFFGGAFLSNIDSNEVFYLDVSQTFNIASPPWTDLTVSTQIPFGSSWAGMSLIDINDDPTVYLFGGIMSDPVSGNDTFISIIHSFNIKTLEWKIPYINGKTPGRRRDIHAVSDNKGKLYVFGGAADQFIGSPTTQSFNDMAILDTTSLIWSYGSILNAPIKKSDYSATILTNGFIVYIGGHESKTADINQINLYDTNLDSWSVTTATSTSIIESRSGHSAVLAPDGNIIIYGGSSETLGSVEPDIAILNIQNAPFEWIVPTTLLSNVNNKPPPMFGHTANLIENYMIVAFGSILPYGLNADKNSKIYIMDISNYAWIDTFYKKSPTLTPTPTPTPTPLANLQPTPQALVIAIIGVLCGIVFFAIVFLGYKLYKKYKREREMNS